MVYINVRFFDGEGVKISAVSFWPLFGRVTYQVELELNLLNHNLIANSKRGAEYSLSEDARLDCLKIPVGSIVHTAVPIRDNHVLACSVAQIFKWNVKENKLEEECAEAWAQRQAAVFVNTSTLVLGTLEGIYIIDPSKLDTPLVFKSLDVEGIQRAHMTTIGTPRQAKTEAFGLYVQGCFEVLLPIN